MKLFGKTGKYYSSTSLTKMYLLYFFKNTKAYSSQDWHIIFTNKIDKDDCISYQFNSRIVYISTRLSPTRLTLYLSLNKHHYWKTNFRKIFTNKIDYAMSQ